jgi:hypothetical protein
MRPYDDQIVREQYDGYIAHGDELENAHIILVGKTEGKKLFGISKLSII